MKEKGVTLIELIIVVAIIGLLGKVAYPAYVQYLVESRRADAQRSMVEYMQSLERYFTANGRYATAAAGATCGGTAPGNPNMYTLSCAVGTGDGVATITATATSAQSGDGDLTLSSTGAKGPSGKWKF